MRRTIRVAEDAQELATLAAELFARWASESIAQRGGFRVALSGGRTPRALFERLRSDYKGKLAWDRVWLYFGDERCVPPDHPDSNYRMAREALGDLAEGERVRRMEGELAPEEAARRYDDALRRDFSLKPGELPRLDLALMGLGPDGHTASLFPGSPVLKERRRLTWGGWTEAVKANRITLTLPVFDAAERVLFLAAGENKAEPARKAIEGSQPPVPAGLVRPENGELYWLLDRAAASRLSSGRASGRG